MNYAAAICYFPKITLMRARNLLTRFSDPKIAFYAEFDDLIEVGFNEEVAHEYITWREKFDVQKITNELAEQDIQAISIFTDEYPTLLKEINDPPPVLFVRGKLLNDDKPIISVVGTRKCTIYGKQITNKIVFDLAKNGITIVSGLALGIDGIAHQAALEAGGKTLAVLGSGVDRKHVYPSSHQLLGENIIKSGGALISEYPPGFMPTQYSFPARNRIIAGLSLGTLVTEAPLGSGALITTERCLDYNRDIFAIPHPITSSQGTGGNNLLKKGATLVTSAEDILNALEITVSLRSSVPIQKTKPVNTLESKICEFLAEGPLLTDEIIKKAALPSGEIMATLTIMEMNGLVQNTGGSSYVLL